MPTMMPDLLRPHSPHWEEWQYFFLEERTCRSILDAWQRACAECVRTGSAEPLHASRDDYQSMLLAYLKILGAQTVLHRLWKAQGSFPLELVRDLATARETLQKHYDSLFPRWQTLEDLEEILLEPTAPTSAELKSLAKSYPPPQAWYDEPELSRSVPGSWILAESFQ
ncbi:MAG: hypothetical protein ACRC8S_13505 [Fimbriiglobus sp.]